MAAKKSLAAPMYIPKFVLLSQVHPFSGRGYRSLLLKTNQSASLPPTYDDGGVLIGLEV